MNERKVSSEYALDRATLDMMRVKEWLYQHGIEVSPHVWQETTPREQERCLFSHGFIGGRKYDFNYYIPRFDRLRSLGIPINSNEYPFPFHWAPCIAQEMADICSRLPREVGSRYISMVQQRNPHTALKEMIGERNLPAFFQHIQEKYHLQSTTPSDYWKYYETQEQVDLRKYFGTLLRGRKILDLAGGVRSHEPVHTSTDIDIKSLQKNPDARYKVQIEDINTCLKAERNLPFQDGSYDAITLNFVVNFIEDTKGLYHECKRILNNSNGVLLVIEVPLKGEFPGKIFEKRRYDPKRTVDELRDLGFSVRYQQISSIVADDPLRGGRTAQFPCEAVLGSLGRSIISSLSGEGETGKGDREERKRQRKARRSGRRK